MAKTTLTAKQMRDQSPDELALRLAEAKKSLFGLRVRATTKELTNPSEIRKTRREIARIQTILAEKSKQAKA